MHLLLSTFTQRASPPYRFHASIQLPRFQTQALLPSSIEANIHRRSNRIQLQHTPDVKNHGVPFHLPFNPRLGSG